MQGNCLALHLNRNTSFRAGGLLVKCGHSGTKLRCSWMLFVPQLFVPSLPFWMYWAHVSKLLEFMVSFRSWINEKLICFITALCHQQTRLCVCGYIRAHPCSQFLICSGQSLLSQVSQLLQLLWLHHHPPEVRNSDGLQASRISSVSLVRTVLCILAKKYSDSDLFHCP